MKKTAIFSSALSFALSSALVTAVAVGLAACRARPPEEPVAPTPSLAPGMEPGAPTPPAAPPPASPEAPAAPPLSAPRGAVPPQAGTAPPPGGPIGFAARPEQGRMLRAAVDELELEVARLAGAPGDPTHPDAVSALLALATAIRHLPNAPEGVGRSAAIIQGHAEHIATSGPHSLTHADSTRAALSEAVVVLEAWSQRVPGGETLAPRIDAARAAVDAIEPSVPFLQQRPVITRAFQEVSDVFAMIAR